MTVEISVPFTLDETGRVAQTQDPSAQANQHVQALVGTNRGERVMMPDYGMNLADYLWLPGFDAKSQQMAIDAQSQLNKWEPNITVLGVVPVGDTETGLSGMNVQFSMTPGMPEAGTTTMTATVLPGGDVIEGATS